MLFLYIAVASNKRVDAAKSCKGGRACLGERHGVVYRDAEWLARGAAIIEPLQSGSG
jgi:hypothetical protein